jgi:hypothetical protein
MSAAAFRGSTLAPMLASGWGPYNLVEGKNYGGCNQKKRVEYHTPFMNAPVGSLAFLYYIGSENIRRVTTVRTDF